MRTIGFAIHAWPRKRRPIYPRAIFAKFPPAGTPRPFIDRLNGTLAKILAAPDMKEKFDVQSAEIVASTPEQFGELIRSETAKWGKIIREKNIRVE